MERIEAARSWVATLSDPSAERKAALGNVLADEVVAVSPLGTTKGRSEVLASLGQSPLADYLARASWAEQPADDGHVALKATLPVSAPVGALTLRFSFDDADRIIRVETTVTSAAPPDPTPVRITETMRNAINGALANGTPVVVAYVDHDGQPHLSFRGSTQVFDDHRLAVWVRNPAGGLIAAIEENPRLAFLYRDPASRTSYQFHGRASVSKDPKVADQVYANSPEAERNLDPQRRGAPLLIDVERIEGRDASGPVLMTRAASSAG